MKNYITQNSRSFKNKKSILTHNIFIQISKFLSDYNYPLTNEFYKYLRGYKFIIFLTKKI